MATVMWLNQLSFIEFNKWILELFNLQKRLLKIMLKCHNTTPVISKVPVKQEKKRIIHDIHYPQIASKKLYNIKQVI